MKTQLIISSIALIISMLSAGFVFWQIRINTNTAKAHLFTTIIDGIHQDKHLQAILSLICGNKIEAKLDGTSFQIYKADDSTDVIDGIDKLLNRFQVVGHLVSINTLKKRDLQTIHYEVMAIGRNQAIQQYLQYLNTSYIQQTGIIHDHFEFFKILYLQIEYDTKQKKSFNNCLFMHTTNHYRQKMNTHSGY